MAFANCSFWSKQHSSMASKLTVQCHPKMLRKRVSFLHCTKSPITLHFNFQERVGGVCKVYVTGVSPGISDHCVSMCMVLKKTALDRDRQGRYYSRLLQYRLNSSSQKQKMGWVLRDGVSWCTSTRRHYGRFGLSD